MNTFLYALSAVLGLCVLYALSQIREGGEVGERRVMQELGLEALRSVNHLSSLGGVIGGLFAFGRSSERCGATRPPPAARH